MQKTERNSKPKLHLNASDFQVMPQWHYCIVDSIASQMHPCQARSLQIYHFAGGKLSLSIRKTINATFVNLI